MGGNPRKGLVGNNSETLELLFQGDSRVSLCQHLPPAGEDFLVWFGVLPLTVTGPLPLLHYDVYLYVLVNCLNILCILIF